jgi:hypothetical protein
MPAVSEFFWNDSFLYAAEAEAYRISVAEAAGVARERAAWRHVAETVAPSPAGIVVGSSDAKLLEGGARAHEIDPGRKGILANPKAGFVSGGPVQHPGFRGTPFMRPAAEAWPELFITAARGTFPKAVV